MGFDNGLTYIHEMFANFIFHVIESDSNVNDQDDSEARQVLLFSALDTVHKYLRYSTGQKLLVETQVF